MSAKENSEDEVTISNDLSPEQLEKIRERAHELYEARGQEEGHELEDWLQAETEVKAVKSRAPKA